MRKYLDEQAVGRIYAEARRHTLNEVRKTLYDLGDGTNLTDMLRFIAPALLLASSLLAANVSWRRIDSSPQGILTPPEASGTATGSIPSCTSTSRSSTLGRMSWCRTSRGPRRSSSSSHRSHRTPSAIARLPTPAASSRLPPPRPSRRCQVAVSPLACVARAAPIKVVPRAVRTPSASVLPSGS